MKRINPNMKLDGHSLRDAIEALYGTFASVVRGLSGEDNKRLWQEEIPSMVFDVAVGAGWLDFDPEDENSPIKQADWYPSPKTVPNRRVLEEIQARLARTRPTKSTFASAPRTREHVLLGDFVVQRAYADSFLNLLADEIAFHETEEPEFERLLKTLPPILPKEERQDLLRKCMKERLLSPTQVARRADVDYSVLVKWKNGLIQDSSWTAKRITFFLLFNKPIPKRRYYRSRSIG